MTNIANAVKLETYRGYRIVKTRAKRDIGIAVLNIDMFHSILNEKVVDSAFTLKELKQKIDKAVDNQ